MLNSISMGTGSKTSREETPQHNMEKAAPELHPSQMLPFQAGLQAP